MMPLPLARLHCMYAMLICMDTGPEGFVAFKAFVNNVVPRQPFLFWRPHVLDGLLASLDLMHTAYAYGP